MKQDETKLAFIYAVTGILRAKGITKYKLAKRLKVKPDVIYKALERTSSSPTIRTIREWSKALEVSQKELFDRMEDYLKYEIERLEKLFKEL